MHASTRRPGTRLGSDILCEWAIAPYNSLQTGVCLTLHAAQLHCCTGNSNAAWSSDPLPQLNFPIGIPVSFGRHQLVSTPGTATISSQTASSRHPTTEDCGKTAHTQWTGEFPLRCTHLRDEHRCPHTQTCTTSKGKTSRTHILYIASYKLFSQKLFRD